MYVCICNGFTDKQVRQATQAGSQTASQVFRSLGHRPQCGKCVATIREMVDGGEPRGCGGPGGCACSQAA